MNEDTMLVILKAFFESVEPSYGRQVPYIYATLFLFQELYPVVSLCVLWKPKWCLWKIDPASRITIVVLVASNFGKYKWKPLSAIRSQIAVDYYM